MIQLSRTQWNVLFAAWLGWGFNIFDSLLFNYVAANCIPTLLGLQIGSPEAKSAILFWTGILTSLLLIGWAIGGIIFGQIADRIGRLKTMLITMLLYSLFRSPKPSDANGCSHFTFYYQPSLSSSPLG